MTIAAGISSTPLAAETSTSINAAASTANISARADLPPVALPNELLTSYTFSPDVRVLVQRRREPDATKTTRVVLYTLPNANTIEHTFGRAEEPGQDWHYQIQHIGAQTRRVQELLPDENLVTISLQAKEKSWPGWRKTHPDSSATIRKLVETLHEEYGTTSTIDLVSHSGGGSFIFGYLNGVTEIPDYVRRIVFIDSNYAFDVEEGHAQKLHGWLTRSDERRLLVLAYDDRNIVLNGKPIVSATGGTFRSTSRMSAAFETSIPLEVGRDRDFITSTGLAGRVSLRAHVNPEGRILHTVLVEKNGFVHALTAGTRAENLSSPEDFYGERRYRNWIR